MEFLLLVNRDVFFIGMGTCALKFILYRLIVCLLACLPLLLFDWCGRALWHALALCFPSALLSCFTELIYWFTGSGMLMISQSGETLDVVRACALGDQANVRKFSVVNTVGSLLARMTNCGVYLNAGREVAVASTKAFTSQVTVLSLIGPSSVRSRERERKEGRQTDSQAKTCLKILFCDQQQLGHS